MVCVFLNCVRRPTHCERFQLAIDAQQVSVQTLHFTSGKSYTLTNNTAPIIQPAKTPLGIFLL